jgi:glycosyltransferase involved in cell wall biosynthesis
VEIGGRSQDIYLEEKRMKVLILAYQATKVLGGGLLSQVESTTGALRDQGVDVEFFKQWEDADLKKYDLCHIFGANIGTYHAAAMLHRHGIATVVSPIFFTQRSSRIIRMTVRMNRLLQCLARGIWTDYGLASDICRWASCVLPNTTDEAKLVTDGLGIPGEKVEVVPNGVEERFYDADPTLFREKHGLEDFILSVGFIGMERKNSLRLLKAMRDIGRPCVLIGSIWEGSYADECLKASREVRNLTILDPLPPSSELLASAYAACDVFVLPSLYETPGIAALEAGLAGARIVITPYGGTKDYFGDLVEYVDPKSESSIRDGIMKALKKEKGDELRQRIHSEYTWEHVARKTLAVYRDITGRKDSS